MSLIAVDRDILNSRMISEIVKWERLLIYRIIVLIRSTFSFWSPKQYHFLTWFKGIINVSDEKINRLINKKRKVLNMKNYTIEEKDSFIVLGIGTEIKSDYTDFVGINKEKEDFWSAVKEDGRLDTLKALATNEYIFL